ncbi:ATP-binding cassette domain-containing protein (plasmid) [Limimaricola variabilis]|uniref:amino acid ABC transporter ATP-binding protein n=1 Tax=Limimaricola variabilis TaxID=1492771 RepID=UPI002AC89564|nr:ATP-binding cassette domain-containing protein [Limimaricola variabilis]WPY96529.1 ATP-binding cassette domain-containing protein [Limimaricola variabilis]
MIEITGLTKGFGQGPVLNGIDLSIAPGERIVVIGPSGTGKSTLLRCLNFLDRPEAGTIRLGDLTVDAAKASKAQILALRRRTAFVFQNYALFANKTARENITEALVTVQKKPRAEAEARAATILSEIGLSEKADSYPAALSGGQQQRVGIGRAMALDAQLMLFDEPTSALDPEWVGAAAGSAWCRAQRQRSDPAGHCDGRRDRAGSGSRHAGGQRPTGTIGNGPASRTGSLGFRGFTLPTAAAFPCNTRIGMDAEPLPREISVRRESLFAVEMTG